MARLLLRSQPDWRFLSPPPCSCRASLSHCRSVVVRRLSRWRVLPVLASGLSAHNPPISPPPPQTNHLKPLPGTSAPAAPSGPRAPAGPARSLLRKSSAAVMRLLNMARRPRRLCAPPSLPPLPTPNRRRPLLLTTLSQPSHNPLTLPPLPPRSRAPLLSSSPSSPSAARSTPTPTPRTTSREAPASAPSAASSP